MFSVYSLLLFQFQLGFVSLCDFLVLFNYCYYYYVGCSWRSFFMLWWRERTLGFPVSYDKGKEDVQSRWVLCFKWYNCIIGWVLKSFYFFFLSKFKLLQLFMLYNIFDLCYLLIVISDAKTLPPRFIYSLNWCFFLLFSTCWHISLLPWVCLSAIATRILLCLCVQFSHSTTKAFSEYII